MTLWEAFQSGMAVVVGALGVLVAVIILLTALFLVFAFVAGAHQELKKREARKDSERWRSQYEADMKRRGWENPPPL